MSASIKAKSNCSTDSRARSVSSPGPIRNSMRPYPRLFPGVARYRSPPAPPGFTPSQEHPYCPQAFTQLPGQFRMYINKLRAFLVTSETLIVSTWRAFTRIAGFGAVSGTTSTCLVEPWRGTCHRKTRVTSMMPWTVGFCFTNCLQRSGQGFLTLLSGMKLKRTDAPTPRPALT